MPAIPTSDQFVRQTPNLRTGVSVADMTPLAKADQAIGQGYENVGKGVAILDAGLERNKLKEDTFDYGIARSKYLQQSIALEDELKNTEDYTKIPEIFKERSAQIKSDTLGQIKNPRLAEQLSTEIDLQNQKSLSDTNNIFRLKEGDAGRGSLITALDNNQNALLATGNEATKNEILTTTNQLIEGAKAKGWIDSEAAAKIRSSFSEGYAANRISAMNEYQQISALGARRGENGELTFSKTNSFADFLSPEKKIAFYNQAQAKINADENKRVDITAVQLANAGKLTLDPTLAQNQKAVDVFWANQQDNLIKQGANQQQILDSSLDMVGRTGIMPTAIKSSITANITNGNTQQRAAYSKYIADTSDRNPKVLNGLTDDTKALAFSISNNIRAGLSEQQSVDFALNNINDAKKQSNKDLESNWQQQSEKINNSTKVVSKFEDQPGFDLFSKSPNIPAPMVNEYNRLSKEFFVNNKVDLETANQMAEKTVRSQWGVSEIGGKKYMKYAPETIYGNQDNWVHKQLEDTFKTPIKDLNLEVDYSTMNSPKPSYYVFKKNDFGVMDAVLDENNMPKKFTPNYQEANKDRIKEHLDQAQSDREKRLLNERLQNLVPLGR